MPPVLSRSLPFTSELISVRGLSNLQRPTSVSRDTQIHLGSSGSLSEAQRNPWSRVTYYQPWTDDD